MSSPCTAYANDLVKIYILILRSVNRVAAAIALLMNLRRVLSNVVGLRISMLSQYEVAGALRGQGGNDSFPTVSS